MNELKDSYNLAVYGDSISKGVIYDEERQKYVTIDNNFVAMVQNKINGMINNCAKFGNTILRGINKFQKDIIKNTPDIAVIEFGGNDCDFNWEEVASSPFAEHKPNTELNTFSQLLKDFVSNLKERDITPVLLTIPPIDADRYFEWISKSNTEMKERLMKWLGSVTKIYWWQERYNSVIINVAEETESRWIDIREAFLRTADYRKFICKDGIHPNSEGHELIARKILECINSKYSYLLAKSSPSV